MGQNKQGSDVPAEAIFYLIINLIKVYIINCIVILFNNYSERGCLKMGMKYSNDNYDNLHQDADVLQAIDENNRQWVTAWKKAVKKTAKTKI
jgi:hypothetical protein